MNLVVGATGYLGTEICRQLAAQALPTAALVRATTDPAKVQALRDQGIRLATGDLRDRSSLETACQGVTRVISTVSSMPFSYEPGQNDIQAVDQGGVIDLIHAAQQAGVQHFVYTSFSGQIDLDFPLRNAKRAVEQCLRDSGLTYTILRPSYFMEAWLTPRLGMDHPNGTARICGSGENPISWISLGDVARFAVECLANPAANNATLELGGPEPLTPLDVVRVFEELTGREFEVEHVPEEALEEQQRTATDPMQQSFAGLMRCYAQGDAIDMDATVQAFGLELTSVREFARGVLAA